jgi:hypothetical protein
MRGVSVIFQLDFHPLTVHQSAVNGLADVANRGRRQSHSRRLRDVSAEFGAHAWMRNPRPTTIVEGQLAGELPRVPHACLEGKACLGSGDRLYSAFSTSSTLCVFLPVSRRCIVPANRACCGLSECER